MYFIGVDLAWSEKNPTGVATIEYEDGEGSITSAKTVETDEEITEYVKENVKKEKGLVLVDAPLKVPNETGRRPAEDLTGKLFREYNAGAYPANRKRLSKWTGRVRGEDITEKLEEQGFQHDPDIDKNQECRKIIEVYPHPSMVTLFDLDEILKYKNKPKRDYDFLWKEFKRYQENLKNLEEPPLHDPENILGKEVEGTKGKELKNYEDILDAVFSAYIGLYYWKKPEECAILGNLEEGYIMTPVKDEMKRKLEKIRSQTKLDSYT